jgi:predicted permease
MSTWWRRVWHLLNRPRFERDLTREIREHREMMHDPSKFGDPHRLLERSRDAWGWNWLDDAAQDIRLGVRTLVRSPWFSLTAVCILTFGIGLNLTFLQMARATVLGARPIDSPDTIVWLYRYAPEARSMALPYAAGDFIRRHNTALASVLMQSTGQMTVGDAHETIDASFVSANWFVEMGYGPFLGRVLSEPIDGRADAPVAAVVSHEFWRTALNADPAIVGSTIRLDRRPVTIAGVAPANFPELQLDQTAVWLPIDKRAYFYPDSDFLTTFADSSTAVLGRLRPGLTIAATRESLRGTMTALALEQPAFFSTDEWLEPVSGRHNFLPSDRRGQLMIIVSFIATLTILVLVVAAANLGNLVLSRATGRSRELGVRIALGARRSRIVRQLLAETAPLGILGVAGGVWFSWWASRLLAGAADLPAYLNLTPDWQTLLVSIGLSTLALGVVGAVPAWKIAQQDLTTSVRDGGQQVSLRLDKTLVRRSLVTAQVAGCCVLLVITGMMVRGAQRSLDPDLGFEFKNVALLRAPLKRFGITGNASRAYWDAVAEQLRANPAVADTALVTSPPLGGIVNRRRYREAGDLKVLQQRIGPSYFAVMQIPILRGRTFAREDAPETAAIISERLAMAMYGTADVVGKGFPASAPERIIVGVAGDAHTIIVNATDVSELYSPLLPADYAGNAVLLVRSLADPATLLPALRQAGAGDPRVIATATLLRDDFNRRTAPQEFASTVLGGISSLTLAMACLGIFGVVSFSVALRTKEFGIHIALGAPRPAIVRLLAGHVFVPMTIGIALGLVAAAGAGVGLAGEPLYLESADAGVYAASLTVFLLAGGLAAMLPGLRLLRSDPLRALRHE